MEQSYEDLKLHSVTKFIKYRHLLRRTSLQFVLSVLVFISLFLLYYSSSIFKFPREYSFNVYLSTLLFSRLTHNLVERKYMFLIFNGILAFLAKSTSSSSSASSPLESTTRSDDHVDVETNKEACGGEVVHEQADYPNGSDLYADEEEVEKSVDFTTNDQYKQDDQEQDYDEEEEEEEEEENLEIHHVGSNIKQQEGEGGQIGEIATEELNRKIEEFIRKMKEEIRIEAQHQLIAV